MFSFGSQGLAAMYAEAKDMPIYQTTINRCKLSKVWLYIYYSHFLLPSYSHLEDGDCTVWQNAGTASIHNTAKP
jgi:hypothetical protein